MGQKYKTPGYPSQGHVSARQTPSLNFAYCSSCFDGPSLSPDTKPGDLGKLSLPFQTLVWVTSILSDENGIKSLGEATHTQHTSDPCHGLTRSLWSLTLLPGDTKHPASPSGAPGLRDQPGGLPCPRLPLSRLLLILTGWTSLEVRASPF